MTGFYSRAALRSAREEREKGEPELTLDESIAQESTPTVTAPPASEIPTDGPADDAALTVWTGKWWAAYDTWLARAPLVRSEAAPPRREYEVLAPTMKTQIPRGEERKIKVNGQWKGSFWNGLYQCMTAIFDNCLMFGVPEWEQIAEDVQRLEVVDGDRLLYSCSGDAARGHGYAKNTPAGRLVAIPLHAWCKHGVDDAPTRVVGDCTLRVWLVRDGDRWQMFVSSRGPAGRRRDFASPYLEHTIRTAETWYGAPASGWRAEGNESGLK
jgi:hypothetical protein